MKRILDAAVRLSVLSLLLCPAIGFSQKVRSDREEEMADLERPTHFYLHHVPTHRAA